jgi:hypothetical protein
MVHCQGEQAADRDTAPPWQRQRACAQGRRRRRRRGRPRGRARPGCASLWYPRGTWRGFVRVAMAPQARRSRTTRKASSPRAAWAPAPPRLGVPRPALPRARANRASATRAVRAPSDGAGALCREMWSMVGRHRISVWMCSAQCCIPSTMCSPLTKQPMYGHARSHQSGPGDYLMLQIRWASREFTYFYHNFKHGLIIIPPVMQSALI